MKKIIVTALCMTFLSNTVALAETPSPDWSEFCPVNHLNAEYQENNYSYGANLLLGLTIVGLPFAIHNGSKYLRIDASNYWASRHKAFENEIATCKSDPNDQVQCFMQIRQIELNKNEIYQQNEIAKRQESLQQDADRQRALQTNRVIDAINKPRTYNFNGNYGNSY